jgi:hypothetical protein
MILTERDLGLLEKLSDYGLLSSRQIETLIFPGIARETVLRRLRRLRGHKLIDRSIGVEGGPLVWWLEEKGAKKIGLGFSYGPLNRNLIEHNATLSQVRLALESVDVIRDWKGEHVLRKEAAQERSRYGKDPDVIPDALLVMASHKGGLHTVALELELTAKKKSRYEEVFDSYAGKKQIAALWYIVPTKKFGQWLAAEWENERAHRKPETFFWSVLKEILRDPWSAEIHRQGEASLIRAFFPMKPVQPAKSSDSKSPMKESAHPGAHPAAECEKEPAPSG